ncbi:LysR family transcriptional regulator [Streptomyces sp. NPDC090109]|uniref:LysR family transcriptional regulator n=1 Tax=unclassified Streptomyces TaxID=2593676 RepID=UPI000EF82E6F|nr:MULTISPECIES: LysR substrate-binding domain-containing protein [unclassified Streptomyces]MZE53213.1 LysR family transcriptional regulator [Streptomyces sp. SID5770]
MNLRRLRSYVVLAEELHFTRAAAKLFVAQQSLSKQIAELEAELGTPLLRRTSRRVELTPAGEVFLAAAREVLARFDRGVAETRRVGQGERATLRVGFVVGAALELTTPILGEFTARRPEARVELHEFGFADPSAGLAGATTDVAFIRLPSSTHGLVVAPLFTEPCVVGVSTAHPLGTRDRVRVADLLDETIAVGRTDDGVWRDFWTLTAHRGGKRARNLVETHSQSEEVEVVAAGMGCNITPAAARRYSPHPGVRFLTIEDHPGSVLAVAHRADRPNPLVASFVDAAKAVRDREPGILLTIQGASGAG